MFVVTPAIKFVARWSVPLQVEVRIPVLAVSILNVSFDHLISREVATQPYI